jgi:hypothetical protein
MSSEASGFFIGALLLEDGPLLVGAALRDGEPAPGVDIEDCAHALLLPNANRAAIAAAVANCGMERVMI